MMESQDLKGAKPTEHYKETDVSVYDVLYRYTKALSTALGFRDLMTRYHSERVYALSAAIGVRYGLDSVALGALRMSSSFHDIGKIGTPDKILMKTDRLDADEWEVMKQHSEIGEKILRATEIEGSEQAALAIRHHHEHYDGGGYPDGLSGEEIPICSRIISIADSYDAMAVTRSYHRARKHSEIMEILRQETGQKHDPQLMPIFLEVIDSSPFRTGDV
jgi:HD-GYP domain-containing protein (c-di-GMP phosphodiesterase class II)